MNIEKTIDEALSSIKGFNLPMHDGTAKQVNFYTRKIENTNTRFQRIGGGGNSNSGRINTSYLREDNRISVQIRLADVTKCNTEEEFELKRHLRLAPYSKMMQLFIKAMYLNGHELVGDAQVKEYKKPITNGFCLMIKLTGTFRNCNSVGCDEQCFDLSKLSGYKKGFNKPQEALVNNTWLANKVKRG